MVIIFCKWLEKCVGGGIFWSKECNFELLILEYDRCKFFDVWEIYIKNCMVC